MKANNQTETLIHLMAEQDKLDTERADLQRLCTSIRDITTLLTEVLQQRKDQLHDKTERLKAAIELFSISRTFEH
jgi:hypothetical protein